MPLVGKVYVDGQELKGQFLSAGYSGHGMPRCFPCGSAIASMVADELRGKQSELPAWLPSHYHARPDGSEQPGEHKRKGLMGGWWCTVM